MPSTPPTAGNGPCVTAVTRRCGACAPSSSSKHARGGCGRSSNLTHTAAAGKWGHVQPWGVGSCAPHHLLGEGGCSSAGPAHPCVLLQEGKEVLWEHGALNSPGATGGLNVGRGSCGMLLSHAWGWGQPALRAAGVNPGIARNLAWRGAGGRRASLAARRSRGSAPKQHSVSLGRASSGSCHLRGEPPLFRGDGMLGCIEVTAGV